MARKKTRIQDSCEGQLPVSGSWQAVRESRKRSLRISGPGRTRTLSERELARDARRQRSEECGEAPETDLERAQDLVYEAWELPAPERSERALRALVLSPRCADAYLLLADGAPSARERLQLCRQAIVAARAAMGDSFEAGEDLWKRLSNRPYLRARSAYARALWDQSELEAAAQEIHELMKLNPGDNLGLRYLLLPLLIQLGQKSEAEALLRHWSGEPSPEWDFNRALISYWRRGSSRAADNHLRKAMGRNPHVAAYLLGLNPVPHRLPDAITFGHEDEAIDYAARAHGAWSGVRGALEWLGQTALLRAV